MQFRLAESDGKITQTAEERFNAVLQQYRKRENIAEIQRQIAKLESSALDESEELDLLKQLFDSEKSRQQIDH
jgi:uncharacterized protein Yka (UPF0111/DUF47 family)